MKTRLLYTAMLSLLLIFSSSVFAQRAFKSASNKVREANAKRNEIREGSKSAQSSSKEERVQNREAREELNKTSKFLKEQELIENVDSFTNLLLKNKPIREAAKKLAEQIKRRNQVESLAFVYVVTPKKQIKKIIEFFRAMKGVTKTERSHPGTPSKVNVLLGLLKNAHEIPFWESVPRKNALALISSFSNFVSQGSPIRQALKEALKKVEGLHSKEKRTARVIELEKMCKA